MAENIVCALCQRLETAIRALKNTGETELAADGATCDGTVSQVSASPGEPQASGGPLRGANSKPGLSETECVGEDDDSDEPKTWKELAEAAISDLGRYAEDETSARRMVSFRAYKERADILTNGPFPAPSQQGDDDAHAQIQALIGRWHRGDSVGSIECEAVLRKAATALKALKNERDNEYRAKLWYADISSRYKKNRDELAMDRLRVIRERDAATTALNAAMQGGLLCPISERDSLSKKVERLEDLLRDATFPTHGNWGGPLCSVKATYEDGSEASKGHEPNRNACAALAEEHG